MLSYCTCDLGVQNIRSKADYFLQLATLRRRYWASHELCASCSHPEAVYNSTVITTRVWVWIWVWVWGWVCILAKHATLVCRKPPTRADMLPRLEPSQPMGKPHFAFVKSARNIHAYHQAQLLASTVSFLKSWCSGWEVHWDCFSLK